MPPYTVWSLSGKWRPVTLGSLRGRNGVSSHPADQGRACGDLEPPGGLLSVVPGEATGPYSSLSVKAGATQCPAGLTAGLF